MEREESDKKRRDTDSAEVSSLVARGHDAGDRLQIDLLGDVAGLDDLLLAGEADQTVLPHLPPVLISPQLHNNNNNTNQSIG